MSERIIQAKVEDPSVPFDSKRRVWHMALFNPDGTPYAPGDTPDAGASAYDIWLANGNSGTVDDFLDSLAGPPGSDGPDGSTGASAYEVWKAQPGNAAGTVNDYLTSLKGAKGDKGDKGDNGNVELDYRELTSNFVQNAAVANQQYDIVVAGTTLQVTVPISDRPAQLHLFIPTIQNSAASAVMQFRIIDVGDNSIKQISTRMMPATVSGAGGAVDIWARIPPLVAARTYKTTVNVTSGAGTNITLSGGAIAPMFMEAISR